MRPELVVPPKLSPGDRVAVVSPSWAAPEAFPARHALAIEFIERELGLVVVEYTTTRRSASPRERAADLMTVFADRSIRAVMATIGGEDQLTVLPHLDPEVARADPKPFFGFSDNTNLLNWLWNLGIAGYHGGSTMVHLGRVGGPHPISYLSLQDALFARVGRPLAEPAAFGEDEIAWNDPAALTTEPAMTPATGWIWHQPGIVLTAPTWGGNLEVLHWNLAAGRWIRPVEDYAGCLLLLETSEEMPTALEVFRMLRDMGERGMLAQFPAVLFGRARASNFDRLRPVDERQTYRDQQRAAVLRAFAEYHPDAMIVFDVDFGHTDPQYVLPYGGLVTVDGPNRTIIAHY
jgi:muramoyltetrapeptide carboxypeptidase LdcA involved in peptidoglycan recycling